MPFTLALLGLALIAANLAWRTTRRQIIDPGTGGLIVRGGGDGPNGFSWWPIATMILEDQVLTISPTGGVFANWNHTVNDVRLAFDDVQSVRVIHKFSYSVFWLDDVEPPVAFIPPRWNTFERAWTDLRLPAPAEFDTAPRRLVARFVPALRTRP